MGELGSLDRKVVYLDTNVFVYAIEGFAEHEIFLKELFGKIDRGLVTAITSELTLAESLIRPLASGQHDVAAVYEDMLQTSEHLTVVPVDRAVLLGAARLRAERGIKLPDAIHVATAAATGCEVFLSNDRGIRVPQGIELRAVG